MIYTPSEPRLEQELLDAFRELSAERQALMVRVVTLTRDAQREAAPTTDDPREQRGRTNL